MWSGTGPVDDLRLAVLTQRTARSEFKSLAIARLRLNPRTSIVLAT